MKHTGFYEKQLNQFYEEKLLQTLEKHGYATKGPEGKAAPIILQCFEANTLKRLRALSTLRYCFFCHICTFRGSLLISQAHSTCGRSCTFA